MRGSLCTGHHVCVVKVSFIVIDDVIEDGFKSRDMFSFFYKILCQYCLCVYLHPTFILKVSKKWENFLIMGNSITSIGMLCRFCVLSESDIYKGAYFILGYTR